MASFIRLVVVGALLMSAQFANARGTVARQNKYEGSSRARSLAGFGDPNSSFEKAALPCGKTAKGDAQSADASARATGVHKDKSVDRI